MKRWLCLVPAVCVIELALLSIDASGDASNQDDGALQSAEPGERPHPPSFQQPPPGRAPMRSVIQQTVEPSAALAAAPSAAYPATSQDEPASRSEQLESLFARERLDAGWTARARGEFESKLARHIPAGSRVRSIECRQSMCRIESAHGDPLTYQQFLESAFRDPSTQLWTAGGFAMATTDYDEAGNRVAVAYLAREGEALSVLPTD